MRLFLAEDGKSGVAVKPDGDIVSVFSTGRAGRAAMDLAVAVGGRKLDAFDTILPRYYAPHGFRAISRTRWNDDFAPDEWSKDTFAGFNNGEPDVVFMAYDPAKVDADYSHEDGQVMEGDDAYDRAVDAQAREMDKIAGQGGMPPIEGIKASPARAETWYRSSLYDALESAPDKVFSTGPQVKAWIMANKAKIGLKDDEIQWSGILEYLDLRGKDKVTKAEIADYLSGNGVKVSDVMKGLKTKSESYQDQLESMSPEEFRAEVERELGIGTEGLDFEDGSEDRYDYTNELVEEWGTLKPDTVYSGYWGSSYTGSIPGTYREILVTLPEKKKDPAASIKSPATMLFERDMMEKYGGDTFPSVYTKLTPSEVDKYEMYVREDRNAAKSESLAQGFKGPHWDERNVLVHLRLDEVKGPGGKRYVRVGEVQSDWGQKGKKEGFSAVPKDKPVVVFDTTTGESKAFFRSGAEAEAYIAEHDPAMAMILEYEDTTGRGGVERGKVPSAPFVTDTKAWVALGIKRAIAHAVDVGAGGVVFGTGQQNADLYDLSKQVDEIAYRDYGEGKDGKFVDLYTTPRGSGRSERMGRYEVGHLADVVGKDIADRIMSDINSGKASASYTGEDLAVGGHGMRAFYDQILPQVAGQVLKKLGGGALSDVKIRGKKAVGFEITPAIQEKAAVGLPLFSPARVEEPTDLAKKFAAAVSQGTSDVLREQVENALAQGHDDWVAAKRGVVSHETTQSVADALARRMGYSIDDTQAILNGKPVEVDGRLAQPAEILAASMAVSRVNVANLLAATDIGAFADRMVDVLNLMIATRAQYSEIARALGNLGWMERKGATTIDEQINERSDVMKAELSAKTSAEAASDAQQDVERKLDEISKKDGGITRDTLAAEDEVKAAAQLDEDAKLAEGEAKKLKADATKAKAAGDIAGAERLNAAADGVLGQAKELVRTAGKIRSKALQKLNRAKKALERAKLKQRDADAWMADAKRTMERARVLKEKATKDKQEALRLREQARRLIAKSNSDITKARLTAQKANSQIKKMRYSITKQRLIEAFGGEQAMADLMAAMQAQGQNIDLDGLTKMFQGMAGAQLKAIKREEQVRGSKLHKAVDFVNRSVLGSLAELFKAYILSKLGTHLLNISSTWLHRMLEMRVTKLIAEAMPGGAGVEQHLRVLHGLTGVTADALAVAKFAMFGEYMSRQMVELIKMEPRQQKMVMELTKNKWLDQSERFIPGRAGRLVRNIGFTALGVEDAFMKVLPYRYSLAMQVASGRPVDYAEAVEYAELNTFQSHADPIANVVRGAVSKVPALGLFVPFTTTLSNLIVQSLRYTPGVGLFSAANNQMALSEARAAGDPAKIQRAIDNRNQAIARSIVGGMVVVLYLLTAGDDDEEPLISGTRPADRFKYAVWRQENGALAIKINGEIISFERFDPFAGAFGLTVAMGEAAKADTAGDALGALGQGVYTMIFDKYFMTDLGEMLMSLKRPETAGPQVKRYFANLLASMTVPGIVAQFPETVDPYQRDTTASKEFWQMYTDMVKNKTPGLREDLAPRLDVHGKPLENVAFRNPAPVRPQTERPEPLNQWLLKLGRGLDPKPKSLQDLPIEEKQRLLDKRREMLSYTMESTQGLTRDQKRSRVEKRLSAWTRNFVNPARAQAGLVAERAEDADVID